MRYTVIIENQFGELEASIECATLQLAQECLLGEYNKDCQALGWPLRKTTLPENRYTLRDTQGYIIDNKA